MQNSSNILLVFYVLIISHEQVFGITVHLPFFTVCDFDREVCFTIIINFYWVLSREILPFEALEYFKKKMPIIVLEITHNPVVRKPISFVNVFGTIHKIIIYINTINNVKNFHFQSIFI